MSSDLLREVVGGAETIGDPISGRPASIEQRPGYESNRAADVEMADHLGYEPHERGKRSGANAPNGYYPKTVTTEIGEVDLRVPRDRDRSFEPATVPKSERLGRSSDYPLTSRDLAVVNGWRHPSRPRAVR